MGWVIAIIIILIILIGGYFVFADTGNDTDMNGTDTTSQNGDTGADGIMTGVTVTSTTTTTTDTDDDTEDGMGGMASGTIETNL